MAEKELKPKIKVVVESHVENVILHLSDLHFKIESSVQAARRDNLLNDLIDCIKRDDWKPNIICITGDIAWSAKKEEYQSAQKWLSKLILELSISPQNIILCPGNHDVILKKAKRIPRPRNTIEANESLAIPIPQLYQDIFSTYSDFCDNLNHEQLECGSYKSYLFGIRQINGVYFLVCNSCWFFKNIRNKKWSLFKFIDYIAKTLGTPFSSNRENVEEKMWLGLPLFEILDQYHRLLSLKESNRIIALAHHPEIYLHEEETKRITDNTPTMEWIKERTDLILEGHSHTLPLRPDGHIIYCGAGYKGIQNRNVFCLIKLETDSYLCQYYTSDQSRPGNKWSKEGNVYAELYTESAKYINDYIINKGISIKGILNKESEVLPKAQSEKPKNTIAIPDAYPLKPITISSLDIIFAAENMKKQIAIAQDFIEKLDYIKAFTIADDVIEKLNEIESILSAKFLSEIYSDLANIEITRVNWMNLTKGIPKDYSRAKNFYQIAKDYYEKG